MSKTERMQWCSRERNKKAGAWIKDQKARKLLDQKEIEHAKKQRTIGPKED